MKVLGERVHGRDFTVPPTTGERRIRAVSFKWLIPSAASGSSANRNLRLHGTAVSFPVCALSARGISIATAKTSVKAGRHRKTYRQEPGHKGTLEVRLRKLAIDGGKTLQGVVAEFAYQQSFQV